MSDSSSGTQGLKRLSVKITDQTAEQLEYGAEQFGGVTTTESLRRLVHLGSMILRTMDEGGKVIIRQGDENQVLTIV